MIKKTAKAGRKQEVVPQIEPEPQKSQVLEPQRGMTQEELSIAESREVLKQPCPAGMKFFESPEGYVMLGEDKADRIMCHKANGGKGAYINPRR